MIEGEIKAEHVEWFCDDASFFYRGELELVGVAERGWIRYRAGVTCPDTELFSPVILPALVALVVARLEHERRTVEAERDEHIRGKATP
jgi:hypothetical protein